LRLRRDTECGQSTSRAFYLGVDIEPFALASQVYLMLERLHTR
jgi:hypothetical protein